MADPVAEVKTVVAAAETAVVADKVAVVSFFAKQVAWVKANWPHLATWAYLAYQAGALKLLAKL
jgi:hypothetical protein